MKLVSFVVVTTALLGISYAVERPSLHTKASAISTTAPVEESAAHRAIGLRAPRVPQRTHLVCQAIPLSLELHVNPGASGVDSNASLR